MMSRPFRYSASAAALLICLLLLTPIGTHTAAALLRHLLAADGWRLEIGEISGIPAGHPSFDDVRLQRLNGGEVSAEIRRVALSPWSFAVAVTAPAVRLVLTDEASAAGGRPTETEGETSSGSGGENLRIPVGMLPSVSIDAGRLDVYLGFDRVHIEIADVAATFESGTRSLLSIEGRAAIDGALESGFAGPVSCRLRIEPDLLDMTELAVNLHGAQSEISVLARGRLNLAPGLPLTVVSSLQSNGPGLEGQGTLNIEGGLHPIAIQATLESDMFSRAVGAIAVNAAAALREAVVVVDSARFVLDSGHIAATGSYDIDSGHLSTTVTLADIALDTLFAEQGGGTLSGTARVDGTLSEGLTARLDAQLAHVVVLESVPTDVRLRADLAPDTRFSAQLSSRLARLEAEGWLDLSAGSYDATFSGHVRTDQLLGTGSDRLEITGHARPDTLAVSVIAGHLPSPAAEFGPLRIDARLLKGRYLDADLLLEDELATVHLSADIATRQLDTLWARVQSLDLQRLAPNLGGQVQGRFTAGGSLQVSQTLADGDFTLQDVSIGDWSAGPLKAAVRYERGNLGLQVTGDGLNAATQVDSDGVYTGEAHFARTRFFTASHAGDKDVCQVTLSGDVSWRGRVDSVDSLVVDAELTRIDATMMGGRHFAALGRQHIRHRHGLTLLDSLVWSTPAGVLHVDGSIGADSLSLSARVDSVDLSGLSVDLAGTGPAALEMWRSPDSPEVRGHVDLREVTLDGRPIGDVSSQLTIADSLLEWTMFIRGSDADDPAATDSSPSTSVLRGRGSADSRSEPNLHLLLVAPAALADTDTAHVNLRARQLDISALLSYALQDSARGTIGLDGSLSFPASHFSRGINWSELSGAAAFSELSMEWGLVRLSLDSEEAELSLRTIDHAVEMRGIVPVQVHRPQTHRYEDAGFLSLKARIDSTGTSALTAGLADVDLVALEQIAAADFELPIGKASARVLLKNSPGKATLDAVIEASLDELGEVTAHLRGSQERGALDVDWYTPVQDHIVVRCEAPWSPAGGIDWRRARVAATSEGINLSVFLDQFPQLHSIEGFVTVDLLARGGGEGVAEIRGAIELEDLQFELPDVKPGFVIPSGYFVFRDNGVEFGPITGSGEGGAGEIALSGFVRVDSGEVAVDYRLDLKTRNMPYNYDDEVRVSDIDTDLSFTRSGSGSLLEGEIRLTGGAVETALVDVNAPPAPPPPLIVRNKFLDATRLDVFVELRELEVKNELADLELEGGARVYGTFYKPRFQGELRVVEGRVIALNREFDFDKGRIVLDRLVPTSSLTDLAYDPLLLDPQVELTATTRVVDGRTDEEHEVTMEIIGPAREAAPQFISPGLGESEVIQLLAFGTTGSTEYSNALYTAAGQLLLSRQVKRVGLDEFQILPSGTVLGSVGQTSIRLGKFFPEPIPLWVRYESAANDPSIGEFKLQYSLGRFLTINANAQSKYELYGVGVGLRKDW